MRMKMRRGRILDRDHRRKRSEEGRKGRKSKRKEKKKQGRAQGINESMEMEQEGKNSEEGK